MEKHECSLPGFHARRIFCESLAADLDCSFHAVLVFVATAAAASGRFIATATGKSSNSLPY